MKIIEKSVEELTPYENNPRKNDGAVDAVAASIREFGFKVPIIIDKEGMIVAGHTRLKAAKKLGLQKVPCIIADDLSPEQIQAFRLADNKTAELADWDFDMLSVELSDLDDIDMSEFGFDMSAFEEPEEVVEDDYEEPEKLEPRTKFGDRYRLGDHILMCGDSTKEEDVQKLIGGGSDRPVRYRSSVQCGSEKYSGNDDTKRQPERRTIQRVLDVRIPEFIPGTKIRRRILYLVRFQDGKHVPECIE